MQTLILPKLKMVDECVQASVMVEHETDRVVAFQVVDCLLLLVVLCINEL